MSYLRHSIELVFRLQKLTIYLKIDLKDGIWITAGGSDLGGSGEEEARSLKM